MRGCHFPCAAQGRAGVAGNYRSIGRRCIGHSSLHAYYLSLPGVLVGRSHIGTRSLPAGACAPLPLLHTRARSPAAILPTYLPTSLILSPACCPSPGPGVSDGRACRSPHIAEQHHHNPANLAPSSLYCPLTVDDKLWKSRPRRRRRRKPHRRPLRKAPLDKVALRIPSLPVVAAAL
jgi:hypothetical protein